MRVYIAIGSNLERQKHIEKALSLLRAHFGPLQLSKVYESSALDPSQCNYYNLVVCCSSIERPESITQTLKSVEQQLGRRADETKLGRVAIDLDLLTYGDEICESTQFSLPRRDIGEYAFVLKPLCDIAPNVRHPVSGELYASMWEAFADKTSIIKDVSHLFS
jgi:2-amino-4-hydroxy-6-hydroxymethyldihydropteridine diphosphokinase